MGGLARICKLYGSMVVNGQVMVWDYATDKAVPESDMPAGSERWKMSEKARFRVPISENQNPLVERKD